MAPRLRFLVFQRDLLLIRAMVGAGAGIIRTKAKLSDVAMEYHSKKPYIFPGWILSSLMAFISLKDQCKKRSSVFLLFVSFPTCVISAIVRTSTVNPQ